MPSREHFTYESVLSRRALLSGALGSAAALYLGGCSPEQSTEPEFARTPDWQQDFGKMPNGPIDTNVWNYSLGNANGWGNEQQQFYTQNQQNVRVQDHRLVIQANHLDKPERPYVSGRIDTRHKQSFGYGKLEIVGRLPAGVGTWSAFWMLPENPKYPPETFGLKPDAPGIWGLNGEIDIMEAVGAEPGLVYPNLHTYDNTVNRIKAAPHPQIAVPDSTDVLHTYGVERTPERVTFTFDHKPYYQVNKKDAVPAGHEADAPLYWPFDQNYYLILNLAMGGEWGGEKAKDYPPNGIDDASGPWQLRVSSIKHYPFNQPD